MTQDSTITSADDARATVADAPKDKDAEPKTGKKSKGNKNKGGKSNRPARKAYMQNRELSWLAFNQRCLDQSTDPHVPLLERMKFIAIWRSNLQEFFMVRVGSLIDLSLTKEEIYDSKTGMTPDEQLEAVYARVGELTPIASEDFRSTRHALENEGIRQLYPDELSPAQTEELMDYLDLNVLPLISPQIVNALHPFPHLENGALYIAVRLDEAAEEEEKRANSKASKAERKAAKAKAAENVIMGIIPLPRNCERIIELTSTDDSYSFILLEHALEMVADSIFEMYPVKYANVIQVTRNADLDTAEEADEYDEDFRTHMQRILKKRSRLAPVRLESERPLSETTDRFLREKLGLKRCQTYTVGMPLDMDYVYALAGKVTPEVAEPLTDVPASPQWPSTLSRKGRITDQVKEHDVLLSYPYESMDPFVRLLQEAAVDPDVMSIKITLYRLASQSRLAEALILAAEMGKEVTALFELRARFDESNNIEWSQRFEQAGCNIIYGFRDYKVHSKICAITRRGENGLEFITQLGTGNYNEKTARLYTDFSMVTADPKIGRDAARFFRNMQLESVSSDYRELWVAPLLIKTNICAALDAEIAKAREGKPAAAWMKTNSVTDKDVIEKIAEASRAGVKVTMLVRGISCIVPGIPGETENVRVVSVVGRLLEHSRIYIFGTGDERAVYLSSADLMTRNLDKRVEIAWPVKDASLRRAVISYFETMLADTAKLRELQPDGTYTELGHLVGEGASGEPEKPFDAQDYLIKKAYVAAERAPREAKGPRGFYDDDTKNITTQIMALEEEAAEDWTRGGEEAEVEAEAEAETEVAAEEEAAPEVEAEIEAEAEATAEAEAEAAPEVEAEPEIEAEAEPEAAPADEAATEEPEAVSEAAEPEPEPTAPAEEPAAEEPVPAAADPAEPASAPAPEAAEPEAPKQAVQPESIPKIEDVPMQPSDTLPGGDVNGRQIDMPPQKRGLFARLFKK